MSTTPDQTPSPATAREVDVRAAAAMAADGAVLLDVREPQEWESGHIAGAVLVPLGDLDPSSLPPGAPIVAVCRSGNRSGQATVALAAAGHDVVNMVGGMIAWVAAGLPTTTGGDEPAAAAEHP